jgi:hypothetical protein
MDLRLYEAAKDNRKQEVEEILQNHPSVNASWKNDANYGSTSLHWACAKGHDSIVSLLLGHPSIDVNQKNYHGHTPIMLACRGGKVSCVRLLLKDPKVLPNEPNKEGRPPLWFAALHGHVEIFKVWIASGRQMNLGEPGNWEDATGIAREKNKTEVLSLLERFTLNQEKTRHEIRVELGGFLGELAAEMFALVVFVSDGLLEIKGNTEELSPASQAVARFFVTARRLPMELQMVLCHRAVGSAGVSILAKDSEPAFRDLARVLSR